MPAQGLDGLSRQAVLIVQQTELEERICLSLPIFLLLGQLTQVLEVLDGGMNVTIL